MDPQGPDEPEQGGQGYEMEIPVDPVDEQIEDYGDPVDEYLVDPEENLVIAPMKYDPSHVDTLIANREWGILQQYLESFMPPHDTTLLHPQVFHICWRRQLTDHMDKGNYVPAAALFTNKIVKLKQTTSPFADRDRLFDEISKVQDSVGSHSRLEHRHRDDNVLQKDVNDYMRLYLPEAIGYAPRKTNAFSPLWEFCIRIDVPVPGKKAHPKIRCLVCSDKTFSSARVTPVMGGHLLNNCAGPKTPNLKYRLDAALELEYGKGKGKLIIRNPRNDGNKRLKLNTGLPTNAIESGPKELFSQQLDQGKRLIAQLRNRQELAQSDTITTDLNSIETTFNNLNAIFASALGQQQPTAEHQMPATVPQADASINALVVAVPVPVPVAEQQEPEAAHQHVEHEAAHQHAEHEAEVQEPQAGGDAPNDYDFVFLETTLPDLPQLSDD